MAVITAGKTQDGVLRGLLKRVALLRESPVGMIGAGLVLFWIAGGDLRAAHLALRPQ